MPDGEAHKRLATLDRVVDALLAHRCDRRTAIVALGGGVVGDLAGFAAATYQRGVPFVQVPTTLLAQVDSSVGGKTAINHPRGKNMIGAFYQPQRVLADMDTLATLPERELRAGLAEVVKHGAIRDAELFAWLEANVERLVRARPRGARARRAALGRDQGRASWRATSARSGPRALLNFGHTFGHAIEAGAGLRTWLHGEAVAAGMIDGGRPVGPARDARRAVGGSTASSHRTGRIAGRRTPLGDRALHRAHGRWTRRRRPDAYASSCSRASDRR